MELTKCPYCKSNPKLVSDLDKEGFYKYVCSLDSGITYFDYGYCPLDFYMIEFVDGERDLYFDSEKQAADQWESTVIKADVEYKEELKSRMFLFFIFVFSGLFLGFTLFISLGATFR